MEAKQMTVQLTFNYIAIDQYGDIILIKSHPRKELLDKTGYKNTRKIYIDGKDGQSHHVGYAIGYRWFDVFRLSSLEK